MTKFALKRIDSISSKQSVDKLFINDKCYFDEFENKVSKNKKYSNELAMIYQYIEYVTK